MLLPHVKEREYRFGLALRMGLPIFILVLILISNTLITTYESLDYSFYIESILLLALSIYFIFFLIYKSFDERITDSVTKTFTREYLYKYLKEEIKKNRDYTFVLISVDNLNDINRRYGIKNGDKVLYKTVKLIGRYLKDKGIKNFPIGHVKGGDFIIGLEEKKEIYTTVLELFYLKYNEFKVDDIEVKISGAVTDTLFSSELNHLVENLFELQNEKKNRFLAKPIESETLVPHLGEAKASLPKFSKKFNLQKTEKVQEDINPTELESIVINAIKNRAFTIMKQDVFENEKAVIKECFFKLKATDGKILHPKTYMKVINKLGLRVDFDLMILEKNIKNCSNKKNITAFSISPTSLRNPLFLTKTKEFLGNNVKRKIIFLLSEAEYYPQTQRYNSILKSLKDLGVLIAIDRVGAIHTSFLYLRDLDIDIIRFDPFYIKQIKKRGYIGILEGFNVMAHKKNVKTWVKMVETQEIKEEIREIGVDYLQGKYMAPLEKIYES